MAALSAPTPAVFEAGPAASHTVTKGIRNGIAGKRRPDTGAEKSARTPKPVQCRDRRIHNLQQRRGVNWRGSAFIAAAAPGRAACQRVQSRRRQSTNLMSTQRSPPHLPPHSPSPPAPQTTGATVRLRQDRPTDQSQRASARGCQPGATALGTQRRDDGFDGPA